MKVTKKPVELEQEKILEISENELTEIAKGVILEETKDMVKREPELGLLSSLLFASIISNLHHKLFSQEETNGNTERSY